MINGNSIPFADWAQKSPSQRGLADPILDEEGFDTLWTDPQRKTGLLLIPIDTGGTQPLRVILGEADLIFRDIEQRVLIPVLADF